MSISGRRMLRPITGPKKSKVVSKIRRTKEQAYTSDWSIISEYVMALAGYKCSACRRSRFDGFRLEAHHVIPVSKGGKTTLANLRCLCSDCHHKQPGH